MTRIQWYRTLVAAVVVAALGTSTIATAAEPPCPSVEFAVVQPKATPATRPVRDGARTIQIDRMPITSTADIATAHLASGDGTTLLLSFKPAAAERMTRITTNHSGIRLAFVVDSQVVLAVTWEGDYGLDSSGVQVSLQNASRAKAVVDTINRCLTK